MPKCLLAWRVFLFLENDVGQWGKQISDGQSNDAANDVAGGAEDGKVDSQAEGTMDATFKGAEGAADSVFQMVL